MGHHTTTPAPTVSTRAPQHRTRPGPPAAAQARAAVTVVRAALWMLLPTRWRSNWRVLRSRPDAGAETSEVVIGIALAAAAAFAVWKFLGPKLLAIAQNAMSGL